MDDASPRPGGDRLRGAVASGAAPARVRRDGARLLFSGALTRPACAGLWQQAQGLLGGIVAIDLDAVSNVDSAGLALLAEISSCNHGVDIVGSPPGLAELRAAYRLGPALDYAH